MTKTINMECQNLLNLKNCNCSYAGCPRKGICCECLRYHITNKELPACFFDKSTEKSYDRSFEKFITLNS